MRRSQSGGRCAGGPRPTAAECILRISRRAALALVVVLTSTATGQAQTPEILYRFGDSSSGPASAALLEASDGYLYGTSAGKLFRMSRAGQITTLHRLRSDTAGSGPAAPLIQARDGSIYGTARFDGPSSTFRGGGTVFRWDHDGSFHVLHGFGAIGDVASPGPLIQGADGNFYGIADLYRDASGEMRSTGAVYRMTPAGVVTVLHVFVGGASDGEHPTSLIQGADGFFYGTTRFGGPSPGRGAGIVFRMTAAGAVTRLHAFGFYPGPAEPVGGIIQGRDGHLYGTSEYGGSSDRGSVFRLTTSGTLTVLHSFTGAAGAGGGPVTSLVETADGTLYGSTSWLESAVFKRATDGTMTVITSPELCRSWPARVSRTADDTIFITTTRCGSAGLGNVLTLNGAGDVTTVHTFFGEGRATGGVVQRADGTMFGTTCDGGRFSAGTVYKLTLSGTYTALHSFNGPTEGECPLELTLGRDGYLYGTTLRAGAAQTGTAFRLSADGAFSVLHHFTFAEGDGLRSTLVFASDGNLYSTASSGGASGFGTLLRMTTAGEVTVLHSFAGGSGPDRDGEYPVRALTQASDGSLYGSAADTIFRVSLTGTYQVLRRGLTVGTRLSVGNNGALYGIARYDTPNAENRCGRLFRLETSGADTTLADVGCGQTPDLGPVDLIALPDESFAAIFAQTFAGGIGNSTLLRLLPNGTRQTVLALGPVVGQISGPLMRGSDEYVYSSSYGFFPDAEGGTVFRIRMTPAPLVRLSRGDFDGDRKSEIVLYRPSTGYWYLRNSSAGYAEGSGNWIFQWGALGDVPQPGDYDGDGLTDIAVYRPSTGQWFIRYSSQRYAISRYGYFEWGASDDVPLSADFDGDGKTDIGVYRPATGYWYLRLSSHNFVVGAGNWIFQWGAPGDIPKLGDFDADRKTDIAVYRAGEWFIRYSSLGYDTEQAGSYSWGAADDVPLVADFDGDRRSDIGVYRPTTGYWYWRLSTHGFVPGAGNWIFQWGSLGDVPKLLDLDGDGRTDISVYRPSTGQWFTRYSSRSYNEAAFGYFAWGATGDLTLPEN